MESLLQIMVTIRIITKHTCYVGTLAVLKCNVLNRKRKTANHIANCKLMTVNRISTTAKSIAINY